MADKDEVKTSPEKEGTPAVSTPPAVDLTKYVPVEQFRAMQSKKDKEVADLAQHIHEVEERQERERQEVAALVDKQPELKANYDLAQLRAKAAQYDQMRTAEEQLVQARKQYAEVFDIPEGDLITARTPLEAFTMARKLEKEKLLEELRGQLGVQKPKKEEGDQEPPVVPVSQGPAPDSTLRSDAEVEKRIRDIETALKDPNTPRREKSKLRTEWLKVQGMRGSRRSSRARV